MKLVRFGPKNQERPGILEDNGTIRDLTAVVDDFAGSAISCDIIEKLRMLDLKSLPEAEKGVRLGSPLAKIGNFICVGLNYTNHARTTSMHVRHTFSLSRKPRRKARWCVILSG